MVYWFKVFYFVAEVLLLYVTYTCLVFAKESCKWDTGFGICTSVQQLLLKSLRSTVNIYMRLTPVSPFTLGKQKLLTGRPMGDSFFISVEYVTFEFGCSMYKNLQNHLLNSTCQTATLNTMRIINSEGNNEGSGRVHKPPIVWDVIVWDDDTLR